MTDPGAVAPTLAQTLGVRALPGLSELDAVVGYLCERRALLVLDNCEHLAEEVARVVAALLRACPSLTILATSRAPLAIRGETRWAVPRALAAGLPRACSSTARAGSTAAGRSPANAAAIAEICRQLDGMPLALELAAARVSVLAPADIARGLDDALGLLSARSCVADPRHQTLHASLDWSYGLLRRRRAAAAARAGRVRRRRDARVRAPGVRRRRARALETLVEHSLVRVDGAPGRALPAAGDRAPVRARAARKTPARPTRYAIAIATRSWHWPSARAGTR